MRNRNSHARVSAGKLELKAPPALKLRQTSLSRRRRAFKTLMIMYGLCFIIPALSIMQAYGRTDTIKKIRKPKHQGLLTQDIDNSHEPAIDTLSSLPKKIDLSSQIETLDNKPATNATQAPKQTAPSPETASAPITSSAKAPEQPTDISDAASREALEKITTKPKEVASKEPAQGKTGMKSLADSKKGTDKTKKESDQDATDKVKPRQQPFDESETPSIEFYFENTDLQNLLNQISEIYHITFITDETISPLSPGAKALKGNKISFKTQKPLTQKEAWNLFLTFLDLAGLSIVPQADPKMFRIVGTEAAQRSSIRSFIGVDSSILPDNDEMIRYVYFIENSSLDTIRAIVDSLRSPSALFQVLQESKAFILTDKAYNIKMLMNIIKELDKITMPQALSVLKLRKVDAKQVADLYMNIIGKDEGIAARLFPNRKQTSSLYFPENTRIFAEPRTNTLILLGPKDAIKKIESFITENIDIDLDKPYSPLKVYALRYADAQTVSDIMNNVTLFGKSTEAGKAGGVRGEDKYLKPMSFTPEPATNRIIIRGDYDDYVKALEIIKKLDEPQPQIAIEMLILSVSLTDNRNLGTQLRSATPGINGLVGNNVKFQTSGSDVTGAASSIVTNNTGLGVNRLLGNLLNLVAGTKTDGSDSAAPGNTVISLGMDQFGVWGIFNVLQTMANLQVISNPFITAVNKTPALVVVGETRRVITATVAGGNTSENAFGNQDANLEVSITPQINSDGFILLNLNIKIDQFLDADPQSARTENRNINTSTIVADKEVLAIGGLIQNKITDQESKVPILGDIPIIGWLFKNRIKVQSKSNLLVLISTRIIQPEKGVNGPFTNERVKDYRTTLQAMESPSDRRDPITRWMFAGNERNTEKVMDDYIFKRQDKDIGPVTDHPDRAMTRSQKRKKARKEKRKQKEQVKQLAQQQPVKGGGVV